MPKAIARYQTIPLSLFLVLSTALAYSRIATHGFVNLDDTIQITENPRVLSGLSWDNFLWSFSPESWAAPLTWLTYTVFFEIFGLTASVFHLLMLCLHIANVFLLFLALRNMTDAPLRSAFVAALFALHPMNVESVAWIAELNNVLSGFFFMLTLLAWHAYTLRSSWQRYCLALALFGLGLMAKPAVMTLPFLLLLLDYWPLGRLGYGRGTEGFRFTGMPVGRLLLEKVPFLALSLVSFVSNIVGAGARMGLYTGEIVTFGLRVQNALVSLVKYLAKMVWPVDLAVLYPFPAAIPAWQTAGALIVLAALTVLALRAAARHPYLPVGWFWFLGAMVPFLGIFQAGVWPEMADRYAYLTFIGVFMAIAWGVPAAMGERRLLRGVAAGAGVVAIAACLAMTWVQAGHWQDSRTLFTHVLSIIGHRQGAFNNIGLAIAHNNLGIALHESGDRQEAVAHYREAVRINPYYDDPWFCLGTALAETGDQPGAAEALRELLRLNPSKANAHHRLGTVMVSMSNHDEAIAVFQEGLRQYPGHAGLHFSLGQAYLAKGNVGGAVDAFQAAARLGHGEARQALVQAMATQRALEDRAADLTSRVHAGDAGASLTMELGDTWRRLGRYDEAVASYRGLLEKNTADIRALFALAVAYADMRDYDRALQALETLEKNQPFNPEVAYNMACVLSRQGKTGEAADRLRQAVAKGFRNGELIMKDPDLYNLRKSREFIALMKELGAGT